MYQKESNTPHKFLEIFRCSKRLDKPVLRGQIQIRGLTAKLAFQHFRKMKTFGALVTIVLLAGMIVSQGQDTTNSLANTATKTNAVNYYLTDNQNKVTKNPTEANIRAALVVFDREDGANALLSKGDNDQVALASDNWEAKGKIHFQYKDGDKVFHTSKSYPSDIAIKIYLSFLSGTDEWQKMVELKPGIN